MEIAIVIGLIYLAVLSVLSADKFIKNAGVAIILACLYMISKTLSVELLFPACIAIVGAICLFFQSRIGVKDIIAFAAITIYSAFWLSTAEFVDGYIHSQNIIAIVAALTACALFSSINRRLLFILSLTSAFLYSYAAGMAIDSSAFASSMILGWVLCSCYPHRKYNRINSIKYTDW